MESVELRPNGDPELVADREFLGGYGLMVCVQSLNGEDVGLRISLSRCSFSVRKSEGTDSTLNISFLLFIDEAIQFPMLVNI